MIARFILAGVLVSLPVLAGAQSLTATEMKAMAANLQKGQTVIGRAAPLDRAGAAVSGSAFQFQSERGDTEASLAIRFALDRYTPKQTGTPHVYSLSSLDVVLTATTPIGDKASDNALFSGDSLVAGSRVKFAITRTSSKQKTQAEVELYYAPVIRACLKKELEQVAVQKPSDAVKVAAFIAAVNAVVPDDPEKAREIIIENKVRQAPGYSDFSTVIEAQCLGKELKGQAQTYAPEYVDLIETAAFAHANLLFMGLDASFGQNNYQSLDRTAFKVNEVSKGSWEVGAYIGLIGPGLKWSLRGRVVYGQTYEVSDEVQLCRTVTGSTDQQCIRGPDGTPQRKRSGMASVEGRYLVEIANQQKIALAPQITYDFEKKDLGVEVPIYLSPDSDGKLTGGLKLAYTSKKDDFGIGLFVGVPFSIFYQ